MVLLSEDQSFSLTANVTSPGYMRVALKGYLVSKRNGETWIAPLIPQLFYGASGQQLATWRQNIPQAGSQVILSRKAGGYPKVPREELYWRQVKPEEEEAVKVPRLTLPEWWNTLAWWQKLFIIASIGVSTGVVAWTVMKKK